jgi:hypothetical protein
MAKKTKYENKLKPTEASVEATSKPPAEPPPSAAGVREPEPPSLPASGKVVCPACGDTYVVVKREMRHCVACGKTWTV